MCQQQYCKYVHALQYFELQGAGFEAEIHYGDMRSRQSSPAHMCA